jgi:FkbM family methyltransferase
VNGPIFREAFLRSILAEFSQPARTFNDDCLRGLKASNNALSGPLEIMFVEDNAERIATVYASLADQESRDTLAFLYLNRALGGLHSHGPHVTPHFLSQTESITNYTKGGGRRLSQHQWLPRPIFIEEYEVPVAGRVIKLDTHDISALEIFLLEEYTYRVSEIIEAKSGDVIIDAGACWGDTALYLAAKCSPNGHVYAFEVSEDNIDILRRNLSKNPDLAPAITILQRPLSNNTGDEMWILDSGATSRVDTRNNGGSKLLSISIDDFVNENRLDKVDFIKFDIEGAERTVIDGAMETIRKHKPTLAISIYHLRDDPFVIAEKVAALSSDYRFFVKGVCKNYGETILFCKSASRGY